MKYKFPYYQDPGHGWIRVPLAIVATCQHQVTHCSYIRGQYAYLEEDLDGPAILQELRDRGHRIELDAKHTDKRSQIRGYQSFPSDFAKDGFPAGWILERKDEGDRCWFSRDRRWMKFFASADDVRIFRTQGQARACMERQIGKFSTLVRIQEGSIRIIPIRADQVTTIDLRIKKREDA